GATYANYVGKPLSYVLATPEQPDDADNPLRAVYGNEGVPDDIERFGQRFGCVVQDGFGSTEGGIGIVRTPDTPPGSLGPLPPGIDIFDPDTQKPCPAGVVGELVNTTGPGRFEGYYNDEAAEAERMAGGVYHSGDLAYRDDAGYAYFAGRLGDWMRVDGGNLGAAPIERVLLRHPDIIEVAVYPVPDPVVGDQVMAALVMDAGAKFDAEKFRAFLAEQPDLGPKQWPSLVRISSELPRTVTFKVLKRQLSAQGVDCGDPVWQVPRSAGAPPSPATAAAAVLSPGLPPPCGARRNVETDATLHTHAATKGDGMVGAARPLELALQASFEQLSAAVPADIGVAIARPDRTYSLGRWWSGVAWSTIKVPLAIAALRTDWLRAKDLVPKAISESDNHASEKMWSLLGDPMDAARRVQGVIAEGGDPATVVESRRLRRGFTAFGQTLWTLQRQARFAAELPSIPD